jgi:hypothetical protein
LIEVGLNVQLITGMIVTTVHADIVVLVEVVVVQELIIHAHKKLVGIKKI